MLLINDLSKCWHLNGNCFWIKCHSIASLFTIISINSQSLEDASGRPNITISAKFHKFSQISQIQPNITILTKISSKFTSSTKYHNFNQISQYWPKVSISSKFLNFSQLSQFCPNFTILSKFHNFSTISQY